MTKVTGELFYFFNKNKTKTKLEKSLKKQTKTNKK